MGIGAEAFATLQLIVAGLIGLWALKYIASEAYYRGLLWFRDKEREARVARGQVTVDRERERYLSYERLQKKQKELELAVQKEKEEAEKKQREAEIARLDAEAARHGLTASTTAHRLNHSPGSEERFTGYRRTARS
ncbi:unnamed protein product [Pedinophyceae sp. YPF-701]|nr:unnamed protein product [Pedinophyceae sp. YPF-701]